MSDYKKILNNWYELFKEENLLVELDHIIPALNVLYENDIVYPHKNNVFRIFREIDPDRVKVVFLGQDQNGSCINWMNCWKPSNSIG